MKFNTLVEITAAAHLAQKVVSGVGDERGGVIFAAPPGQLKTTAIEYLDIFPKTKLISNLTMKSLNDLRPEFLSGEVQTIGFPDYDMIYKRHSSVSDQIEGTLMSLMGEGYRNPAFSDQRVNVMKARCTIIAGITIKCYESRLSNWIDTGFARRFLWSRWTIKNPDLLEDAIAKWKRHNLNGDFILKMPTSPIPHNITNLQAKGVLYDLRFQHDRKLPFIFAQRLISVLCWKHGIKEGWNIWNDFAPSLGKEGASVVV
jgi:hypothetical protein